MEVMKQKQSHAAVSNHDIGVHDSSEKMNFYQHRPQTKSSAVSVTVSM